jgi:hypothetical protein
MFRHPSTPTSQYMDSIEHRHHSILTACNTIITIFDSILIAGCDTMQHHHRICIGTCRVMCSVSMSPPPHWFIHSVTCIHTEQHSCETARAKMLIYTQTHKHTYVHTRTHTHTHAHTRTHTCVYMHTHAHTHTHMHTHAHIYIRTYTHTGIGIPRHCLPCRHPHRSGLCCHTRLEQVEHSWLTHTHM